MSTKPSLNRKMLSSYLLATILVIGAGFLLYPSPPDKNSDDFKITLRLSHVFAPKEELTQFMDIVAKRILEKTSGAIEIITFPQGQIATYKDGVEMVVPGSKLYFGGRSKLHWRLRPRIYRPSGANALSEL